MSPPFCSLSFLSGNVGGAETSLVPPPTGLQLSVPDGCSLVAPLCLSSYSSSLSYPLAYSQLHSVLGPVQPSSPATRSPPTPLLSRFWSQLRPVLSLSFSGRDSSQPAEQGPRPVDPHQMTTPCSEGSWGRMWFLRPSQDTRPPHLSLASASHSHHCSFLTFQPQQGKGL